MTAVSANQSPPVLELQEHPDIQGIHIVAEESRLDFLPKHFPTCFSTFESTIFTKARKTISGYTGGYWEFAEGGSGIPFVIPRMRRSLVTVTSGLGDNSETLSPILAGVHTTMLALLAMAEQADRLELDDDTHDHLLDTYHSLKDLGYDLAKKLGEFEDFHRLIN